jgi:hypothetical protein
VTQLRLQAVLDALDADLAWLAAQRESPPVAVPAARPAASGVA